MVTRRRKARIFSAVMLLTVGFALFRGGTAAYHTFRDSFVAPAVLSPDSDQVVQSRLNLLRLTGERRTLSLQADACRDAIRVAEEGIKELEGLSASVPKRLVWAGTVAATELSIHRSELLAIHEQKGLLDRGITEQAAYVEETKRNLQAGLVRQTDLAREEAELDRLRIAAIQRERERASTAARHKQRSLEERALRDHHDKPSSLVTPEMLATREQIIRIEVELLRLQHEKRTKEAELQAALEGLQAVDGTIAQLKERPIFQAIESQRNVAFVPYTQIDGVTKGARIYRCGLWGVFFCHPVGAVLDLLPGEVAMQDPWGSPARGQYAILQLDDASAAREKVLRVRNDRSQPLPELAGAGPATALNTTAAHAAQP